MIAEVGTVFISHPPRLGFFTQHARLRKLRRCSYPIAVRLGYFFERNYFHWARLGEMSDRSDDSNRAHQSDGADNDYASDGAHGCTGFESRRAERMLLVSSVTRFSAAVESLKHGRYFRQRYRNACADCFHPHGAIVVGNGVMPRYGSQFG